MDRNSPRISAVIIARDAVMQLPGCLASLEGAVDDVLVVDTGSHDGTQEAARAADARLIEIPWIHFAHARNVAIGASRGTWVFMIDADERLSRQSGAALRAFAARDAAVGGRVVVDSPLGGDDVIARRIDHPVRFFRRLPGIEYRGMVHEGVEASLEALGGRVVATGVRIQHDGFRDPTVLAAKRRRDLRLLWRQHAARGGNLSSALLWHLGLTLYAEGRDAQATSCLERVVGAGTDLEDGGRAHAHARLADLHLRQADVPSALVHAERALELAPGDGLCRFVAAQVSLAAGHPHRTAQFLHQLTVAPGLARCLRAGRIELLLGDAFLAMGDVGEAARAFLAAARAMPGDRRPVERLRALTARGARSLAASVAQSQVSSAKMCA
jgi:hypothetical protein